MRSLYTNFVEWHRVQIGSLPAKRCRRSRLCRIRTEIHRAPPPPHFMRMPGAIRATFAKNIGEIIYRCCKIKGEIVEKDERDTGERLLLNFGHTLGHAIEAYTKYKEYSHGEAVSIGMVEITKLFEKKGICEKNLSEKMETVLKSF